MALQRPALCTVPRGARSICETGSGTYAVGCALSNSTSNDVSSITHADGMLSVTATTSHAFELWSLCALPNERLLAGSRTHGQSHLRLLGPSSGDAHALTGNVLSVHVNGTRAYAVTSEQISGFDLGKGDLNPLLQSGPTGVDNTLLTGTDIVSGGPIAKRLYAAHRTSGISLTDPRSAHQPQVTDTALSPSRKLRISCATALNSYTLALCSEHGDLALFDLRHPDAPSKVVRDAHVGWITTIGAANSDTLITGGADGVIRVWTSALECATTLPLHADSVYGITATDDMFATVSFEGRVAVNPIPGRQ